VERGKRKEVQRCKECEERGECGGVKKKERVERLISLNCPAHDCTHTTHTTNFSLTPPFACSYSDIRAVGRETANPILAPSAWLRIAVSVFSANTPCLPVQCACCPCCLLLLGKKNLSANLHPVTRSGAVPFLPPRFLRSASQRTLSTQKDHRNNIAYKELWRHPALMS
jgi:hypothetical protein